MIDFINTIKDYVNKKFPIHKEYNDNDYSKIISYNYFEKSKKFRNVLNKEEFIKEIKLLKKLFLRINYLNNEEEFYLKNYAHNIASTFEDKKNYKEAVAFYTLSSNYINFNSLLIIGSK